MAAKRPSRRTSLAPRKEKRGLDAAQIALAPDAPEVAPLAAEVRAAGGAPIGAYREPLSGRAMLLAALPLAAVQPTPFQRDLSPTHTKRLAQKIDEAGAFLDPIIVVRGEDGRLWTPNGRHRLAAAKVLGLKQISALVSPDERLAFRILALNTEKAHNLKDRSLEVIRMARNLARAPAARQGERFRRRVRGAGVPHARHPLRRGREVRRRRVRAVPEEGRPVLRSHAGRQPARAGGLRGAPARHRRGRAEDREGA